ncbi:metal-sensitive transcriptional regulator [Beijerinckia sp. L45]|uniref:metal-sensitive transcriptional regulator n=1 Tax=Beijerinckia sp. L45 TaxID=1641855 RepID=UPI001FED924B|nr:metal-sensitive transcriptional regulator [Beijerinckia sp. L45]
MPRFTARQAIYHSVRRWDRKAKGWRMKTSKIEDGKIYLHRSDEEKKPLIHRLNRVEGQVRGLKAMIEADRYCADELQQIKAAVAALRQVAVLIVEQHVAAASLYASKTGTREAANADMMRVLREALKL